MRRRLALFVALPTLLLALAAPLRAQDSTARADSARTSASRPHWLRTPVRCVGQRVDSIIVTPSAPSVAGLRRVPLLGQIVRGLHTTTHRFLIRRFLALSEGQPCTELRREESERILRAQPFLAEASVLAFENSIGGVNLEVRTSDETSLIAAARIGSGSPFLTGFRLGNSNFSGRGIHVSGKWRQSRVFRDEFSGRYVDYQFSGRPYLLTVEGKQEPQGSNWQVETAHPFLTDLQRVAWRARSGAEDGYVGFHPGGTDDRIHALRLSRQFFDIGGIVRVGPPGRLSLFGVSFSGDRDHPAATPVVLNDSGPPLPDTVAALMNRYREHHIARVNALWGVRDIRFLRAEGFDALTAVQDVPIGFQLGTLFGRSLSVLGSGDDDIFMAAELYGGGGTPHLATRLQLRGEGRRSNDRNAWDGILFAGRAAQYLKPSSRHTMVASVEYSGGWRQRIPFSVSLGDDRGGIRGYRKFTAPGGQRLVGRFESRQFLGRPNNLGDAGVGVFADVGKQWAGDVPFGKTTTMLGSMGVSLLGAVPARSARMWRVDVSVPFDPNGVGRRLELRIWSTDRTGFYWREPGDVESTRERTVPNSIFSWP